MRRILIFSLVYYPRFVGGAEVAIKEITDRVSDKDVGFDMVTLRFDSSLPRFEKVGNINVYRIGWAVRKKVTPDSLPWYMHLNKYAYVLLGFFKANSLNRKNKYDAIWSMMATYNSFAALFFKLRHRDVRFILTLQEGDPTKFMERRALPFWPLFKMIFSRADYIQTISNFLADWAKKMGAKCPVEVVPNGVDMERFSAPIDGAQITRQRASSGFSDQDTVLVTASRLVKKNAVDVIISALQYVDLKCKLLILGEGPLQSDLKSQISSLDAGNPKLKIASRVVFKGFVSHSDLPAYLRSSDIFVRPSRSEGLGNSFLEAMAAGLPVISTSVGGIKDFLRDGETGLVCEVNNPRSVAQKVDKLTKDRESREYIVSHARDMVMSKYSWEGIAERMKGILLG